MNDHRNTDEPCPHTVHCFKSHVRLLFAMDTPFANVTPPVYLKQTIIAHEHALHQLTLFSELQRTNKRFGVNDFLKVVFTSQTTRNNNKGDTGGIESITDPI